MKSLLICIMNNRFESAFVANVKAIMSYRLGDCDISEDVVQTSGSLSSLEKKCFDAYKAGYDRIYIQAATLAYSDQAHREIVKCIDTMRSRIPDINLTVFSPLQLHEICSDEIERNVYHESLSYIPWVNTSPDEIQHISFSFISRRLRGTYDDPDKRAVVVRVIHATADFDVERIIRFSDSSIASCKEALRAGAPIVTDVGMVSAGIATRFRDRTICAISQPGVQEYAAEKGLTRSAAAMELLKSKLDGAIIAIGNAPTALVQALSIVKTTGIRPSCIVGVPIGFVGAAESHELLMKSDVPWISIKGNRGGSPIAVAIVNAIGSLL